MTDHEDEVVDVVEEVEEVVEERDEEDDVVAVDMAMVTVIVMGTSMVTGMGMDMDEVVVEASITIMESTYHHI